MLENKELNVSLEWKDKKIKQLEDKIEGDMGVYGIAVLNFFSRGISVILI